MLLGLPMVGGSVLHQTITLSVGWRKGGLVIAVTDTGCGIAAEYRECIFDPGFRGAAVEGHGLGHSFVRSVTRFYGGAATCSSAPGQGATFTVTLPLKAIRQCL